MKVHARDPKRIGPFLAELRKLWESSPDRSFFQLVDSLAHGRDAFFVRDDIALDRIREQIDENQADQTPLDAGHKASEPLEDGEA